MQMGLVVFPGFQLLDLAGPTDVFTEATRLLPKGAGYQIRILSVSDLSLASSSGARVLADQRLEEVVTPIDTLLVCGCPALPTAALAPEVADALRRLSRSARRYGSICTGAFALARSGLLDGHRATTHWASAQQLAEECANVTVESDQVFVRDGSVYTSAGVTAGMDLALALVEEDWGRDIARQVARQLLLFLKRPGGQSQFSTDLLAQCAADRQLRKLQHWVLENLKTVQAVTEMAERCHMSMRHFTRVFRRETGMTPHEFLENARLEAARRKLEQEHLSAKAIAADCGFGTADSMRRVFLRRLGVAPSDYRERFQQACSSQ